MKNRAFKLSVFLSFVFIFAAPADPVVFEAVQNGADVCLVLANLPPVAATYRLTRGGEDAPDWDAIVLDNAEFPTNGGVDGTNVHVVTDAQPPAGAWRYWQWRLHDDGVWHESHFADIEVVGDAQPSAETCADVVDPADYPTADDDDDTFPAEGDDDDDNDNSGCGC
jgi:hypothetical protein